MSFSSVGWYEFGTEREYPSYKWMELARSADFLCRKVMEIQPKENVVILADSATDSRVVHATAAAAHTIGAKVTVLWSDTKGDVDLPPHEPIEAAVLAADIVVQYSVAYLDHSKMWSKASEKGVSMLTLTGLNADNMVRTINPDFHSKMMEFGEAYRAAAMKGKRDGRVQSQAGTDFTFKFWTLEEIEERAKRRRTTGKPPRGVSGLPGYGFLNAKPSTLNGTMVFDGSFWPTSEAGLLKEPIEMKVKEGMVTDIVSDHLQARIVKNWFTHFHDPDVYQILHVSTGWNPGVKRITGGIDEDERFFGGITIGMGVSNPEKACHTDGIIVSPSIWIDDELIEKDGIFVEPTLKRLAKGLGMQLWTD